MKGPIKPLSYRPFYTPFAPFPPWSGAFFVSYKSVKTGKSRQKSVKVGKSRNLPVGAAISLRLNC